MLEEREIVESNSVLAVIEKSANPLDVFLNFEGQVRPALEQYAADMRSVVIDASSEKGRKAGKSFVHSIRKEKAAVIANGDKVAKAVKELPKKVDESRRLIKEFFDSLIDEKYAPIAEWERAEEQRTTAHKAKIAELQSLNVFDGFEPTSAQINERMTAVNDFDISGLEEFTAEAEQVKTQLTANLSTQYIAVKQSEEQAAELERLRIAEQKRLDDLRIENEAKQSRLNRLNKLLSIPDECQHLTIEGLKAKLTSVENAEILVNEWLEQYAPAVNGKAQVISQLQKMIADAEQAEAERVAKLQQEAAEKAKAEAEAKAAAEAAKLEADRKAKEAAELKAKQDAEQAEAQRKAQEQAESERLARIEAEKKANIEHRRIINNAAAASFEKIDFSGTPEEIAKRLVIAIANGEIIHVSINY